MMKPTSSLLFVILLCCAGLSSCSSSRSYVIQLRDGRQVLAASRPELQKKTGYYRYKDTMGRDALLRDDEIIAIQQRS